MERKNKRHMEKITVVNIFSLEAKESENQNKKIITVTNNDLTPTWKNLGIKVNNKTDLKRLRKWLKYFVEKKFNKKVNIMLQYIDKAKLEN
jgi:hypothetical protein